MLKFLAQNIRLTSNRLIQLQANTDVVNHTVNAGGLFGQDKNSLYSKKFLLKLL